MRAFGGLVGQNLGVGKDDFAVLIEGADGPFEGLFAHAEAFLYLFGSGTVGEGKGATSFA